MSSQATSVAATVASETKPGLKRSASTASLPTPPRTQRRRRTVKKRALLLGPESDIAEEDSGAEDGNERQQSKRRKLSTLSENDKEDEDAFWSGLPAESDQSLPIRSVTPKPKSAKSPGRGKTVQDSPDSPVPMLTRRRKAEASGSVLLSPPPSHRRPAATRKTKKKAAPAKDVLPVIAEDKDVFAADEVAPKGPEFTFRPPAEDATNNPFLDSPTPTESNDIVPKTPVKARKPSSRVRDELPMLTMVTYVSDNLDLLDNVLIFLIAVASVDTFPILTMTLLPRLANHPSQSLYCPSTILITSLTSGVPRKFFSHKRIARAGKSQCQLRNRKGKQW